MFNILGDAVPGRPFFDVFAGTGVVGIEAFSRAPPPPPPSSAGDFRLIDDLERNSRGSG
ncbi:MAG: RsmD family RNA methyltransferase [Gemmataceae bacterium]